MPLSLPSVLVIEKNQIATKSAWILLVEITLPDAITVLRFARNNEDVIFDSDTYYKLPFEIDPIDNQSRGQIPQVNLKMSNVTRTLQTYLEQFSGGIGSVVRLIVINSDHLNDVPPAEYAELELNFEVVGAEADANYATFTLGVPNPLSKLFPLHRYIANHCNWVSRFKGVECGYAGAATVCDGTLTNCRILLNSARFGGFIGLDLGGVRFA